MKTIITEKMVFGGDCLAKIEGKNVFVPFALPGEKLEVEILESKKDYDIAKIVNIPAKNPPTLNPPFGPILTRRLRIMLETNNNIALKGIINHERHIALNEFLIVHDLPAPGTP